MADSNEEKNEAENNSVTIDIEERTETESNASGTDIEEKYEFKIRTSSTGKEKKDEIQSGEYDEDGVLHISGVDVIGSTTREDWQGASLELPRDANPSVARAHVTCPHCAAKCTAGAGVCWNCGKPLHGENPRV